MDWHPRRSPLRFELPTPGTRRSLCIERFEGDVCEGLRGCMEQGHEPRSLRPCVSAAKRTPSTSCCCCCWDRLNRSWRFSWWRGRIAPSAPPLRLGASVSHGANIAEAITADPIASLLHFRVADKPKVVAISSVQRYFPKITR